MKTFEEFQQFREILCICPDCNTIVRVSDLKIKTKDDGKRTWLDDYEKKCRLMADKENKFGEVKAALREKAVKKGRDEAQKVFNNAINPKFEALKFDPYDLKPILNPIDFLVFKDMNKEDKVNDIVFLSKKINNPMLNKIRKQVETCVKKEKYEWKIARIDNEGGMELEE
jgi:predicted Holliday junction resolvase-like endonuclease